MITGFALIDKPEGWTSHDVVGRLRRLYGQRRVGHAGTLDPMATGVLVCGLGHATRLLRWVQGQDKTYTATIRLGIGTLTDDREGEITARPGYRDSDPAELSAAISALTGEIRQRPSSVSAIKVDGQRAYAKVRAGNAVELAERSVTVSRFEVLSQPRFSTVDDVPVMDLDVAVVCSSGTYIRALARDVGARLGSAGHLTALRRTHLGAIPVGDCEVLGEQAPRVRDVVEVMAKVMPVVEVPADVAGALRNGQLVESLSLTAESAVVFDGELVGVAGALHNGVRAIVNMPT